MENIREDFLHFIWENGFYRNENLTINQQKVKVVDPGQHNKASGPDFFNAKIKIGDTLWAGNVEIHVKASDWFLHNHQDDPAFNNVILHVVFIQDCRLQRADGEEIPCMVLQIDQEMIERFLALVKGPEKISCRSRLDKINKIYWNDWFSKLMIGRLQEKTLEVDQILSENKYNWEETLYYFLGKSFGFKVNTFPFESLVRTTPLNVLQRFRNKPLTINAILFGQAGFLEDLISEDEYYISLQREYHSLIKTLPPRILDKFAWKFMGTRPGNFPLVRIAQFASVIVNQYPLFASLTDHPDLKNWRKVLKPGADKYWEDHYLFGKTGKKRKNNMGKMAMDLIILNAFVPVIFHYGTFRRRTELKDKVLSLLEEMPPEKNVIIDSWNQNGVKAINSFESQALIQLTTKYCRKKYCLKCMIGNRTIAEA
jgi:hypothetical protein